MNAPRGLQTVHGPLTGAFPRLERRSQLAGFELPPEDVERFREQGYLAGLPLLDAGQVEELRTRLGGLRERLPELRERLYEVEADWRARPEEVVLHFLGGWLVDEWLHDLVFHPGVTVPLAQLLGVSRLRFWHDQVFWKPARHPGVVPWHQDYSYWRRTEPANHLTMLVTLDDMGPWNGGLEVVPGSHRWELLPTVSFGGAIDQVLEHLPPERRRELRPVPVEMAAGRASIHHSHLVHGSRGNPSERPRRALVLNYICLLYTSPSPRD